MDDLEAALRAIAQPPLLGVELAEAAIDLMQRQYQALWPQARVNIIRQERLISAFDDRGDRLIAAICPCTGPAAEPRDAKRMQGFPLGGAAGTHRGHAVAHQLGGGLDQNLIPQDGRLNIGAFRRLERRASASVGSLYGSYLRYATWLDQRPCRIAQLLCPPEGGFFWVDHQNAPDLPA